MNIVIIKCHLCGEVIDDNEEYQTTKDGDICEVCCLEMKTNPRSSKDWDDWDDF